MSTPLSNRFHACSHYKGPRRPRWCPDASLGGENVLRPGVQGRRCVGLRQTLPPSSRPAHGGLVLPSGARHGHILSRQTPGAQASRASDLGTCSRERSVKESGRGGVRKGGPRFRGEIQAQGTPGTWAEDRAQLAESTLGTLWALILLLEGDTGQTTPGWALACSKPLLSCGRGCLRETAQVALEGPPSVGAGTALSAAEGT